MAFRKLRRPSLRSTSSDEDVEETAEDEEATGEAPSEAAEKRSRLTGVKKTLVVALAAGVAVATVRRVRSRRGE